MTGESIVEPFRFFAGSYLATLIVAAVLEAIGTFNVSHHCSCGGMLASSPYAKE